MSIIYKLLNLLLALYITVSVHDGSVVYYEANFNVAKVDLQWGMAMHYMWYVYVIIIVICWLTDVFNTSIQKRYWIYVVGLLCFFVIYAAYFQDRPMRMLLYNASCFIGVCYLVLTNFIMAKLRVFFRTTTSS